MSPPGDTAFATVAQRLCGQCAVLFGWRPAEFWEATPTELACVLAAMRGPDSGAISPLDRGEMQRLMERDNG